MAAQYAPAPRFKPPVRVVPSLEFMGESSTAAIHTAVGRALSAFEHAESAWSKAFQLFCEARSLAACRAYGTIESVTARNNALRYAAKEFLAARDASDEKHVLELLNLQAKAGEHRNRLAHGMAMDPHGYGYFLCPASYATKSRKTRAAFPTERWGLSADYFYRVNEIEAFRGHFEHLLGAVMSLTMYLNEKYRVLKPGEFHP